MADETSITAHELLAHLERAVDRGVDEDNWSDWKAVQDRYLTYVLKDSMSEEQRIRLHELTHGFARLADPDGSWSQRLSERLDREMRAAVVRAGVSA